MIDKVNQATQDILAGAVSLHSAAMHNMLP